MLVLVLGKWKPHGQARGGRSESKEYRSMLPGFPGQRDGRCKHDWTSSLLVASGAEGGWEILVAAHTPHS